MRALFRGHYAINAAGRVVAEHFNAKVMDALSRNFLPLLSVRHHGPSQLPIS